MITCSPVSILLVDNEPDNLEILEGYLAGPGIEIVLVSDGQQALAQVKIKDFAVIVLDLHMPGMSGFEVAQRVRANAPENCTPIIFVTGSNSRTFPIEQAYALGAVDYLVKPVNPVILSAKVDVFVELYRSAERKHSEIKREHLLKEVQAANDRLGDVFKHAPAFMAVLRGPDHVYEMVNDLYIDHVGNRAQAGLTVRQALPELAGQGFYELLDQVFATGEPFVGVGRPIVLQRQPNHPLETRYVDFVYTALRDAHANVSGVLVHGIDQTERRHVEAALRASEERYRMLFESMDQAFCIVQMQQGNVKENVSVNFRILEANAMVHKHTGLSEPVGKTLCELAPDTQTQWIERLTQVVLTGQSAHFEDSSTVLNRYLEVFAHRVGNPASQTVALLFSDITARKKSEKELRQLAASLAESDRRKTEFLATLAHELRNPLAPITAGLGIVRMQTDQAHADQTVMSQTLDMLERQVGHMVNLIDDLLDIARISGSKLELKKRLVTLKDIIDVAIETSQPHIVQGRHELLVRMPDEGDEKLMVDADPTRIAQVVANLLNNAAKYTPAGGRIELSVRRDGQDAVISVVDNGIGLAPGDLQAIFELFSQANLNANRAHGGLGIGLSLVRQLVEMHGGVVNASSPGLLQGSTFTVMLPLASHMTLPAPVYKAPDIPSPLPKKELRILVVDDHVDAAKSLATLLAFKGHVTEVAYSGLSAVDMATRFRPDVAFLDIGMPGMDGYETAQAVRKIAGLEKVLLIALTGWGTKADRARSAKAGFDHHLTKPAALDAIDALLAKITLALPEQA